MCAIRTVKVVLSASANCWISVHRGGPNGPRLYEGILTQGQSLSFRALQLWMRAGAPDKLTLTVGGRPQPLPTQTANLLVNRRGVKTV